MENEQNIVRISKKKNLVSVLESLNYHQLLTDPSGFRNDETNTNIFVHIDDGLMFGPKNEV